MIYWQVAKNHTLDSTIGKTMGKKKYKSSTTTRNLRTLVKVLARSVVGVGLQIAQRLGLSETQSARDVEIGSRRSGHRGIRRIGPGDECAEAAAGFDDAGRSPARGTPGPRC